MIDIDALKRDKRPQSSTLVHALIDRLEAAEKERDKLKELNIALCTKSNSQVIHNARLAEENDTLHAKIEAMERQEPSEQDASVRKAWARFSHELHRSPDAPYPGMADAFEQHFSQSFIDREWKAEAATWAAAWKAAKRHCGQIAPSVPDATWLPVPDKHPTFDPVDLQLADGSVLCGCVPQSDGDYWWEGPSGEVFIDPRYAPVTHWRLSAAPEARQ